MMARLYTKTGDKGETGLFDGSRVGKDHPRVQTYGDVDELNALIGLCRCVCHEEDLDAKLEHIQHDLFVVGADLATPEPKPSRSVRRISAADSARLESWIDQATEETPPLTAFILPAGAEPACRIHHARTVCRRAERRAVALSRNEPINERVIIYLNRLGDLLFAWARLANHRAGGAETAWKAPSDP